MRKWFVFVLAALSLALTAVPAAADRDDYWEGRRDERREAQERRDRELRELRERERREERRLGFLGPNCYSEGGYWAWDGFERVWVPSRTICR